MNEIVKKAKASILHYATEYRRVAIFLLLVYLIALFPLFRANYNYRDDVGRVLWAFDGWQNFGRITSNTLSHIIHADYYLRDISPLTQIIAVILMVISSMVLLHVVRGKKKLGLLDAISVLPLGLFPYFLCCFSYKYDSPYMALSVLVSILPLAIRKQGKLFYLTSFVCSLLMCTTYQASSGLFPMLVVYRAFHDWKEGTAPRKILQYCLFSAFSYIAALLVFFLFIPKGNSGYVAETAKLDFSSLKHIFENYWSYISTFKNDFTLKWFAIIAVLSVLFFFTNAVKSCQKMIWTIICCAITLVLLFIFSFGPYPFLEKAFLMPRGMYGLNLFVTLLCLDATSDIKAACKLFSIGKSIAWISVIALSWMCIVFTSTYGNALAAQKSYNEFRAEELAVNLAELPCIKNDAKTEIQIVGSIGYAAGIKSIPGDRIMLRLIPPPFSGDNYWSYLVFLRYYGLPNLNYTEELVNEDYLTWEIAHASFYHVVYTDSDRVIVILK